MTLEQLFGNIAAFALTLMTLTYILGDNPLYRFAMHLFIGVAAGYAALVAIQSVLLPRLFVLLALSTQATLDPVSFIVNLMPWLLGAFILFKISPRLAPLGNTAGAFLVGVGAAVAVGGAITGTLFPQVLATAINPLNSASGVDTVALLVEAGLIILGTIATLMYFHYSGHTTPSGRAVRPGWLVPIAVTGETFITIALAALYAGALSAAVAIFAERIVYLVQLISGPLLPALFSIFGA